MRNLDCRHEIIESRKPAKALSFKQSKDVTQSSNVPHSSVQNLSLKYLSPESQRMVTMTAS